MSFLFVIAKTVYASLLRYFFEFTYACFLAQYLKLFMGIT